MDWDKEDMNETQTIADMEEEARHEADETAWKKARWYNGMMAAKTARANKTVVCGHWHASFGHSNFEHKGAEFGEDADFTPYYGKGVIAIDACTAHTGFVNCLVIDDGDV